MIRDGVYYSVISSGRPASVETMTELIGPATWWVRPEEVVAYASAGAASTGSAEGLVGARNAALDAAFAAEVPCLQLSDDLTRLEMLAQPEGVAAVTIEDVVSEMLDVMHLTPFRLAGVAPTSNAFYASMKVKRRHFVVGDLILVLPSPLRFDPVFRLKEDYDFTCQHIVEYGGVCRLDYVLASFKHRSNPGGAVADRTADLEREMIAQLKARWPGWFRDNKRRKNEVLLRPPRLA